MRMRIKLSEYAKLKGVTYRTAWQWFKDGIIGNTEVTHSGRVWVSVEEAKPKIEEIADIYARVSNAEQKDNLIAQAGLCEQFCASKGLKIRKIYKEVGSGMNDNRKMLNKIFEDPPQNLVVLYKDRLTRFGFNYIKIALKAKNCNLIIINENQTEQEDLLKDFIAIITSFCCRLYGARRGQAKALKMKDSLKNS